MNVFSSLNKLKINAASIVSYSYLPYSLMIAIASGSNPSQRIFILLAILLYSSATPNLVSNFFLVTTSYNFCISGVSKRN
jgi:hypothetical protein